MNEEYLKALSESVAQEKKFADLHEGQFPQYVVDDNTGKLIKKLKNKKESDAFMGSKEFTSDVVIMNPNAYKKHLKTMKHAGVKVENNG